MGSTETPPRQIPLRGPPPPATHPRPGAAGGRITSMPITPASCTAVVTRRAHRGPSQGVPAAMRRAHPSRRPSRTRIHRPKNVPQKPHAAQLDGEPQPVVLTAAATDQLPVDVIEVEEPLQLRPRRRPVEPPVHRSLLIAEELHRHGRQPRHDSADTHRQPLAPDPAPPRFRPRPAPVSCSRNSRNDSMLRTPVSATARVANSGQRSPASRSSLARPGTGAVVPWNPPDGHPGGRVAPCWSTWSTRRTRSWRHHPRLRASRLDRPGG